MDAIIGRYKVRTEDCRRIITHPSGIRSDITAAEALGLHYVLTVQRRALMRRRARCDLSLCLPALAWSRYGKALVSCIGAVSRPASARQTRRWTLSSRKQGRGEVLIMRTSRAKAKSCNHAQGSDTQQQMKAFIPAEAITPANISLTCQPAQAAPLAITRDRRSTIHHLIPALLPIHQPNH